MKRTGLARLAVVALVGGASLASAYAAPPTVMPSPGYDARLQEQRAASRAGVKPAAPTADYAGAISAFRRAHGLKPVKLDARLNAAALKQAQAMAAGGSISHSAAGSFASRMAPLRKSQAAENIGAGFLTFAEMLKQWQNSPGHRANLLLPGVSRVGVAFVDNPRSPYRKFWAMVITD